MFTTAIKRFAPSVSAAEKAEAFAKLCIADPNLAIKSLWLLDEDEVQAILASIAKKHGALEALFFSDDCPKWLKHVLNDVLAAEGWAILS